MSYLTELIVSKLNLSFNMFNTLGLKNAGSVGPRCMFRMPKAKRASKTTTAFCSYHAMLNTIGKSFMLFRLNSFLNSSAKTIRGSYE